MGGWLAAKTSVGGVQFKPIFGNVGGRITGNPHFQGAIHTITLLSLLSYINQQLVSGCCKQYS